jgi:hypothetical protein
MISKTMFAATKRVSILCGLVSKYFAISNSLSSKILFNFFQKSARAVAGQRILQKAY